MSVILNIMQSGMIMHLVLHLIRDQDLVDIAMMILMMSAQEKVKVGIVLLNLKLLAGMLVMAMLRLAVLGSQILSRGKCSLI